VVRPGRIAIVSDVHGSLTALDAVIGEIDRQAPDLVVHGGDLVVMGPQPAAVADRIRDLGWAGVVGNTDELLWRPDARAAQMTRAPKLKRLLELLFDAYRPHTCELLGEDRIGWLRELPAELEVDGLRLLHASPGDLWRAPPPDATSDELERLYGAPERELVGYGHIHRPYVRRVGTLTVFNCGSVGMPWDGDPRASFVLVDDGRPRVIRVGSDVERDAALLRTVAHPDAERLAEMRRRGVFIAPATRT
jgi:putative phosphoesterase